MCSPIFGLENKFYGLGQVFPGLVQRVALCVRTWQFFNKGDVAFRNLLKNGG